MKLCRVNREALGKKKTEKKTRRYVTFPDCSTLRDKDALTVGLLNWNHVHVLVFQHEYVPAGWERNQFIFVFPWNTRGVE